MKKFITKRDYGIVNGSYRKCWRIFERIGKGTGKNDNAEEYPQEMLFKTKEEAENFLVNYQD